MENDGKQSVLVKKKIAEFKEILTKSVKDCNAVYLVGHKNLDFDAIASLGAMALVCKRLKKAPYIVIDQGELDRIENDDKKFYEHEMLEKIKEKFVVINLDDYENNKQDNSLLIILDTSKGFMTPFKNHYEDFKKILVLDHHKPDENTIKVNNKLILESISSCSEVMYWLLKQYKITPSDVDYYTFLLIGINLDTKELTKSNTMPSTHDCVKELVENHGADKSKAKLFLSPDFESMKRSYELFNKAKWLTMRFAISVDNEEVYTKNEVSVAADLMEQFVCEAAIFCGKNADGKYEVSARSNRGNVDISYIMNVLNNGGGSMFNAACEPIYIDGEGPEENEILENKIKDIIYLKEHKKTSSLRKRFYVKGRKIGK